jgi:hypothetical protein
MPDLTAIAAALSSLNTLKNLAQAMIGLRDGQVLQEKVIEFNSALIDAQTKIFGVNEERTSLIDRIRELEKEVSDLKDWDREKRRYELIALAPNLVAYAIKDAMRGTEPPHYVCANCYTDGKKSYLQQVTKGDYFDKYHCNSCGEELGVNKGSPPTHYARPFYGRGE